MFSLSISAERSASAPVRLLHQLPLPPFRPLLVSVEWTGEVEGQGSPQWLRGRVGEVEQRAGGHHWVITITVGLDSSHKSSIYRLDLRGNSWSHTVTFIREQLGFFFWLRRSSDWLILPAANTCEMSKSLLPHVSFTTFLLAKILKPWDDKLALIVKQSHCNARTMVWAITGAAKDPGR